MNIGILAYRQYPFISANTAIAYTIGNSILEHKVIHIGKKDYDILTLVDIIKDK